MKMKLVLALAALTLPGGVLAGDVRLIEEALELSAAQVTLPFTSTGNVSVRACEKCDLRKLPLNARTEFRIEAASVSLSDFRQASRSSKAIYVFYDLETGFVTRMVLDMPHAAQPKAR